MKFSAARTVPILVTVFATICIVALGAKSPVPVVAAKSETANTASTELNFSFEQIAELALEEYNYRSVAVYESEKLKFLVSIPFTSKRFIFVYDGQVQAGVRDMSEIKINKNDRQEKFVLETPGVEILSSTIDTSSIDVYDQSYNPLRQHGIEDVAGVLSDETSKATNEAIQGGILERAQGQLEEQLVIHVKSVIENSELEDYAIEIERV